MGDQTCPAQQLGLTGLRIQQQAVRTILNCPDMLHASVLKAGNQGKIEFLKGVVNGGVLFQPAQCGAVQVNRIKIARDLLPVALSVQHRLDGRLFVESRAEIFRLQGEQVGADQLRGRKAQALFPSASSCCSGALAIASQSAGIVSVSV